MKKISLLRGGFSLVDNEDYEFLSQWNWTLNSQGYAIRTEYYQPRPNRKAHQYRMHHVIIGGKPPKGLEVDHINHNKLDNRKSNLRVVTRSQNVMNIGVRKSNKSGFKGVYQSKRGDRVKTWVAEIRKDGKRTCIGYYHTAKDAARAYNEKAKELHGEFAYLNQV